MLNFYCDLCNMELVTEAYWKTHQEGHCLHNEHCISTDATCAADMESEDHWDTCCHCKELI